MARRSRDGQSRERQVLVPSDTAFPIIARLNGASSYTFSGLDGDTDELYELLFWVDCSGNANLAARFNGDSGANYNTDYFYSQNGAALAFAQQAAQAQMLVTIGTTGRHIGRALVQAKSNGTLPKQILSHNAVVGASNIHASSLGWWNTTNQAINSITIFPSLGTMTGTLVLRKVLQPSVIMGGGNSTVPLVTALPKNDLYDGRPIDYLADAVNGVVWPLRYVASEPGAYKWYARGRPQPLRASVTASQSTASTTFVDLTTVGPTITVPLAGEYIRHAMARATPGSGTPNSAILGISKNGVTASADLVATRIPDANAQSPMNYEDDAQTAYAAGDTLKLQYRAFGGFTSFFQNRILEIWPVRVG